MLNGTNLAGSFAAVTPSDSTVVGGQAYFVGGAGNVVLKNTGGSSVTFACAANSILPVSSTYVMAATTATGIVALY